MSSFLESLPRPTKTYRSATYDRISKHSGFNGQGKTILVTGGANGIGYNISAAFAAAGVARIAIVARSQKPLEDAKTNLEATHPSVKVLIYKDSITDRVRMTEILQELGTLDVLILNAAVAHRREQATNITAEEMQDAFDINVLAAFNLSKAYLAMPMPEAGSKTILNVSASAVHIPTSLRVGYG